MADRIAVLELVDARPVPADGFLTDAPLGLCVMPGDCVLIETADARRARDFADLCAGLLPISEGVVRFEGIDWREPSRARVAALRGRIGRLHGQARWSGSAAAADADILLPRLHHTRIPRERLGEQALLLAQRFGLPGLPLERVGRLSEDDALRAAAVRAFLGRPSLVMLENPLSEGSLAGLAVPLLRTITEARDAGAAVVALTRERAVWQSYRPFVTHHLRLHDGGLSRTGAR